MLAVLGAANSSLTTTSSIIKEKYNQRFIVSTAIINQNREMWEERRGLYQAAVGCSGLGWLSDVIFTSFHRLGLFPAQLTITVLTFTLHYQALVSV